MSNKRSSLTHPLTCRPRTLARPLAKTFHLFLIAVLLAGFAFAVQPARPVYAATLTVTTTADELASPGTGCSLREAITNANNNASTYPECYMAGVYGNDTITFAPATSGMPIVLTLGGTGEDFNATGDLDILAAGGDLIIQGRGATNTIIDGAGGTQTRVFHVFPDLISSNTCTFDSVTIRNGGGNVISYGGGIYNHYGTVTVDNSTVSDNRADACGGGIYNDHGTLNVQNGSVIGGAGWPASNTAAYSGGGIYNYYGTVTVDNSTVSGNRAASAGSGSGGGIFNLGTLFVQNGSVIGGAGAGNRAGENGGGIYNSAGTTTVVNSTISHNEAAINSPSLGRGGGIYNSTSGTTIVDNSTVSNNTSQASTGGIFNYGTLNIQNGSTIGGAGAGNTAFYSPGGIWNSTGGTTTVTGSRILYNTATTGSNGGVGNSENTADAVSVTGSCIVGNSASSFANDQTAQQTATGNWWGAATGPNTPCADTTDGNVDTSGFLAAPILGCPGGCSDLQVNKANDTGGNGTVGTPFNWTLTVANTDAVDATFNAGQRILEDDLPAGPTYGAPTPSNLTDITNSGNINCAIAANTLTCDAVGANVTIGATIGRFDVVFSVTPNATGVLTNPIAAGNCRVDPDGNVTESDETDNNCPANSVTVAPAITVTKQANVTSAEVGETIIYTYRVTNTGDVTLNPVSANDDRLGAITLGKTSLAPGASTSGTATYVVQESDLPGPLANTVTVTGTLPTGPDVTATADESVTLTSVTPGKVYLPLILRSSGP